MSTKKLRPLGQVTEDLEVVLNEMVSGHELQAQEIVALVYYHLKTHRPDCFPNYTDGSVLHLDMYPIKDEES